MRRSPGRVPRRGRRRCATKGERRLRTGRFHARHIRRPDAEGRPIVVLRRERRQERGRAGTEETTVPINYERLEIAAQFGGFPRNDLVRLYQTQNRPKPADSSLNR